VKVTFEGPDGKVRNRLVYRTDEASLELAGLERAWSFADDRRAPLRLALLVIAGLMIVPAWSAMSSSADDQDACRIGA
jgi:hypothetical protein